MKTHPVEITLGRGGRTYFVSYLDRKKGHRYHAGMFEAADFDLAAVIKWVYAQPHLELIEAKGQS